MLGSAPRLFGLLAVFVMTLVVLALGSSAGLAQGSDKEYGVKAAFLRLFCLYVDWPKNAVPGDETMYVIGILGPDSFGANLDTLAMQTAKNKKIVVQRFASAKDFKPCHLLFIAAEDQLAGALAKTKGLPVLLVSDTPGLAQKGAMINLFLDEQKTVKFEVNPDAGNRAGLKMSSQLIKVAPRIVKDAS